MDSGICILFQYHDQPRFDWPIANKWDTGTRVLRYGMTKISPTIEDYATIVSKSSFHVSSQVLRKGYQNPGTKEKKFLGTRGESSEYKKNAL